MRNNIAIQMVNTSMFCITHVCVRALLNNSTCVWSKANGMLLKGYPCVVHMCVVRKIQVLDILMPFISTSMWRG